MTILRSKGLSDDEINVVTVADDEAEDEHDHDRLDQETTVAVATKTITIDPSNDTYTVTLVKALTTLRDQLQPA